MELYSTYYAIIIYIIIMVLLVITKPSFIYDDTKKKYREFGNTDGKSLFTLPVISVVFALIIVIIFKIFLSSSPIKIPKKSYKYIPIPYYPQQMPMYFPPQNIFPTNPTMSPNINVDTNMSS